MSTFFKEQVTIKQKRSVKEENLEFNFRSRLHNPDVKKQLTECLRAGVIEAGAPYLESRSKAPLRT